MKCLFADWLFCISWMTIADLRCLFVNFEMFAVDGARCVPFSSTREANSYFEERIASTFGEETPSSANG